MKYRVEDFEINDNLGDKDNIVKNLKEILGIGIYSTPVPVSKYWHSSDDYFSIKINKRKYRFYPNHMSVKFGKRFLCKNSSLTEVIKTIINHYTKLEERKITKSIAKECDLRPYMIKKLKEYSKNSERIRVIENKNEIEVSIINKDKISRSGIKINKHPEDGFVFEIKYVKSFKLSIDANKIDPDILLINTIQKLEKEFIGFDDQMTSIFEE